MKCAGALYGNPCGRTIPWSIYFVNIIVILVFWGLPARAQGNIADLALTLDRSDYCIGDPWKLDIANAPTGAAIRLLGISNSVSWEIQDWAITDQAGHYSTTGTFDEDAQGLHQLSVEIAGMSSNAFSLSVSNCREWTPVNTNLGDDDITSLAADSSSAKTLYAGTQSHGVFKSTNGGDDWAQTGLEGTKVNILVVDSTNPGILYAGTDGKGLVRSSDAGATWENAGPDIPNVSLFTIDPRNSNILLAGYVKDQTGTFFRSTDAGVSWTQIIFPSQWMSFVAIDPMNPDVIYQVDYGFGGMEDVGYLRKTSDGGKTWSSSSLHDNGLWHLVIDPTASSTLFAYGYPFTPAWKSTDGAKTWEPYSLPVDAMIADKTGVLYAISQGVIYRSIDHGGSWNNLGEGTTWMAQALTVSGSNPGTVFAGTSGSGVYENLGGISLTLDRGEYCIGDSWDLDIVNAPANSTVHLMGVSNGTPWEIQDWTMTDQAGHYSTTGTFGMDNQGFHQLSVEIGAKQSNIVSFTVSNCSGAGDWDY
jgi:photosystem II stability/assembly factor-like uncharacterized protein